MDLSNFHRFSDPALLILASLAGGSKHGYAMMEDITNMTGTRLSPGTLYGALARLEHHRLIEPEASSDRRRPYRLTPTGAAVLQEQLTTLRDFAAEGLQRLARPCSEDGFCRLYPRFWRTRYEDEFTALLEHCPLSLFDILDIVLGALNARLHPQASPSTGPVERKVIV